MILLRVAVQQLYLQDTFHGSTNIIQRVCDRQMSKTKHNQGPLSDAVMTRLKAVKGSNRKRTL